VDVHDLAADLVGVAAVLEGMAYAEDTEGRCTLCLAAEAVGSAAAAAAVGLSEVLARRQLAVNHLLLLAGPSSSLVTSSARQPRPVPAAVSAVVHLALWFHSEQQLEATGSAQHEATSSSHSDCVMTSY
jgi:alkylation response protein AidB-like acyl-CoA dehydrogenase